MGILQKDVEYLAAELENRSIGLDDLDEHLEVLADACCELGAPHSEDPEERELAGRASRLRVYTTVLPRLRRKLAPFMRPKALPKPRIEEEDAEL